MKIKPTQLALAAAMFVSGSAFAGITARLEPAQEAGSNSPEVRFTMTNTGKSAVSVVRWETPFTGIIGEVFEVTINGVEAEYVGRHYKWADPQDFDMITLKAGESRSITVDLSAAYNLSETGVYQIAYRTSERALRLGQRAVDESKAFTGDVASAPISMFVEGVPYSPPAAPIAWSNQKANAAGFTSCSSTQQTAINTGMNNAGSYAANSLSYLNAGTRGLRYTTWFGTYDATRYNTVKAHYVKIDEALRIKPVTFNCSCTDSAFAYVYKTQPYNIFVCNAFWTAPATGTDSKAGTIIHELSHFTIVADTDDHAYGQTAAKSLAKKRVSRAIDNADSHEYFSENTPFQN
ncbi:MAG: peptidase M35 [Ahniella sp.]|nr:peptidase M35 [Ahniella sp.]